MRKRFLYVFVLFILFVFPATVKANYGDLNYEITNVTSHEGSITFKGWAFIHRTNNFTTVESGGSVIASDGDQKILMRAINETNNVVLAEFAVDGSSSPNYNFYCELFLKKGRGESSCDAGDYRDYSYVNVCENDPYDGSGPEDGNTKCYYEDIAFKITFDTSSWNVMPDDNIHFEIAASNADYEYKLFNARPYTYNYGGYYYDGNYYTEPEPVYIIESALGSVNNDFITVDENSLSTSVFYLAAFGQLGRPGTTEHYQGYATYKTGPSSYAGGCSSNVFPLVQTANGTYDSNGKSWTRYGCLGFLGGSCKGTHRYRISIGSYNAPFWCPGDVGATYKAVAYGAHVKMTGDTSFRITVETGKKCDPVIPNDDNLYCNDSTVFRSDCEELTVRSDAGSANVKIQQTGTISSVLTPNSVYAGGGFNFGIMYTNTIKWNYVSAIPNNTVHAAINTEMNRKIKDYNAYIAGINITGLEFGNEVIDITLKKQCTASSVNNNYYGTELTVTCIFYIPESVLLGDGDVDYITDSAGLGISNKYYTPMGYEGAYPIRANIVGMNRIKDSYAREDSAVEGVSWTGDWSDTFENCEIDIYPLFYIDDGRYNFIYRPIDINNPFPNRNPGINWFEWYSIESNRNRLESTYSRLQYSVSLDNAKLTNIKNYNSTQNSAGGYFDWHTMSNGKSTFVNEYFSIKRENIVGDSS